MDARLSNYSGQDATVYEAYDGGDPGNAAHQSGAGAPWHRRLSPEMWLWLIVVGAIAALWGLAGGFRKILS